MANIEQDWNYKKTKIIMDALGGHTFFQGKKVLDLSAKHADVSATFYRLGAEVTAVDVREEHLKIAAKKYPGIKTIRSDLDCEWGFSNFDIILSLNSICHLKNFEGHLRNILNSSNIVALETAICDSNDPNLCPVLSENKDNSDWSYNGFSARPTAAFIERVFTESSFDFKRLDSSTLNIGPFKYDWILNNTGTCDINKRRFWIATRNAAHTKPQPVIKIVDNSKYLHPNFLKPRSIKHIIPIDTTSHPPLQATMNLIDPSKEIAWKAPIADPPSYHNPFIENNQNIFSGKKKFVIVIPSYKNSQWCEKNIISCINLAYDKYRVIFTDDCSPDDTFEKVKNIVDVSDKSTRFILIKNERRVGALENLYNMIWTCDDDEIILTLDGDDWFPDSQVLTKLDAAYADGNTWMSYGQYKNSNDGSHGIAQPYPTSIIDHNNFRSYAWCASHLRTFYTWLFKKIKKEDLMKDGQFHQMTWDFSMMMPQLEMSGHHSKYIGDCLYVYNLDNPINDHKVNRELQANMDRFIRGQPKYSRVNAPEIPKPNVGLLLIATNKYDRFLQSFITSADKHFLNDCNVSYYVFIDNPNIQLNSSRKINLIPIEHKPFPFASMDRFKHFTNNTDKLSNEQYLFYSDVDSLIVADIKSDDILGELVGVQHCGYYKTQGPIEDNPNSQLFVKYDYRRKYKHYYGGGFSGGRRTQYLELAKWCFTMIERDVSAGIIPKWHDETAINRYFLDHPPTISLTPSFHYPQNRIEYYRNVWKPDDFKPVILLLEKNHSEIRS